MSHLETTKTNLKRLASNSLELALNELERLLSPNSPHFNSFLLIKGQFKKSREEFLLGILSQKQSAQIFSRLMSAVLQLAGDLTETDLILEKEDIQKSSEKRGELLYYVPHKMQVLREEKCIVRIAWLKSALFNNWTRRKDDISRSNLRIAEIMGVELINLSDDAPFIITSLNTTVQFLDEDDFTEWIFFIKPLRAGNYPLVIRISVIEMRNNREVKRELVLEEQVNVDTEAPQTEIEQEELVRAPVAYFSASGPFVEAPAFHTGMLRRYGTLIAIVLMGIIALLIPKKRNSDDIVITPPDKNIPTEINTGTSLDMDSLEMIRMHKSQLISEKTEIESEHGTHVSGITGDSSHSYPAPRKKLKINTPDTVSTYNNVVQQQKNKTQILNRIVPLKLITPDTGFPRDKQEIVNNPQNIRPKIYDSPYITIKIGPIQDIPANQINAKINRMRLWEESSIVNQFIRKDSSSLNPLIDWHIPNYGYRRLPFSDALYMSGVPDSNSIIPFLLNNNNTGFDTSLIQKIKRNPSIMSIRY